MRTGVWGAVEGPRMRVAVQTLLGLCVIGCFQETPALAKPLFQNPQFTAARPDRAVSADFDGDGRLDLAITTRASPPFPGDVLVLHGEGDGTFSGEMRLGAGGPSIVAGDFDGDGFVDLVTTAPDAVVLFPGRGDGTFGAGVTTPLPGVTDLAAGDVDGNGRDDLVVASDAGCRALFADGRGSFVPPAAALQGSDAMFAVPGNDDAGPGLGAKLVALGDFDGDRLPDIVCLQRTSAGVDVLQFTHGEGDGSFVPTLQVAPPGPVVRLTAGDLDADGRSDAAILIATGNTTPSQPVVVYFSDPGGFSRVGPLSGYGSWLSLADVDGDGQADLVTSLWGRLQVLVHTAPRAFSALADQMVSAPSHALGDFDGDGRLDLVVPQEKTVFMGKGDGTFDIPRITGFNGPNTFSVALSDLDEDGLEDLVQGQFLGATTRRARTDGGFDDPGAWLWVGSSKTEVAVGDFDGDGHEDLLGVDGDTFTANTRIYPGRGDGTFFPSLRSILWDPGKVIAGDLNHDGRVDFLLNETQSPSIVTPHAAALGDFDEDGQLDVVVAANAGLAWQRGAGDGTFGPPVLLGTSPVEWDVVTADFDRDGHVDVAVAGDGELAVLFGHGDGTFEPRVVVDSGWPFRSIVTADFDRDGWPDLFVAIDKAFYDPVYDIRDGEYFAVLHANRHDRSFAPASTRYAMGRWVYQMTVIDFDRDGFPDVALGTDYGVTVLKSRWGVDSDGDGAADGIDCAPDDPGAFAVPVEVEGVAFAGDALVWESQALTAGAAVAYDVVRGALPVSAAPVCVSSGTNATTITDGAMPAVDEGYWYDVRATNVCGSGGYGAASNGTPRAIAACP